MLKKFSLIAVLFAIPSHATQEDALPTFFADAIAPYFDSQWLGGVFYGKDHVSIAYRYFSVNDEKGALVILPGRGEPFHKYAELVYDLRGLGYSVYLMSHRGQGESGRIEGCSIQYVESYDDYVNDFGIFMQSVVHPERHAKTILLGHSMGGAIGTLYALRNPGVLDAMILSSPMFDMNTPPFPKKMASALSKAMVELGLGKTKGGSDKLKTTSSLTRKAITDQMQRDYSSINSQKISFGWARASLDVIAKIQAADLSSLPPVLLLQAGHDLHVPAEAQNAICEKLPSCTKVTFPDSLHEILMENDGIRNAALSEIENFLF